MSNLFRYLKILFCIYALFHVPVSYTHLDVYKRQVLEYCADPKRLGAKTLFATHYHELTAMEGTLPGVKNYNICLLYTSHRHPGGDPAL